MAPGAGEGPQGPQLCPGLQAGEDAPEAAAASGSEDRGTPELL